MYRDDGMTQLGLPRPGKATLGLMLGLGALWLMFAVGLNWGGAPGSVFLLLTGDTAAILHGEVWRLLTAPLLHAPRGLGHILTTVLTIYFFGSSLEEQWGRSRYLRFVALTAVFSYVIQMLFELILPGSLSARLVAAHWFGMGAVVDGMAIAWALSFRGQVVRLFFVLPVTSGMLIGIIVALNLLRVAAADMPEEGMLAPFGGMLLGWLLGGGTPSPLRRAWLKLRLAQLDSEARREGARRRPRRNPGGLRVIPGGRSDDDKGPDGRWLN